MLNDHGGIESDLTVARLAETDFMMTLPAATVQRDLDWLRRHVAEGEHVSLIDVTSAEAVIAVMGPKSRTLLSACSPHDFSNESFAFGGVQEIEIGMGLARAHRVSYVGELGWEIYCSSDQAGHIYEAICEAGQDVSLKPCGMHVLDSVVLKKAFRHFGHDISDEDHIVDAGLSFAVAKDKTDFIGYDAVMRRETGRRSVLCSSWQKMHLRCSITMSQSSVMVSGCGYLTSGNYGHYLGGSVGMGYIPCAGEAPADIVKSKFEVLVNGTMAEVTASLKPLYDATHSHKVQQALS